MGWFFFREYLARSSGGVVLPGQACTHRSNHLGTQASNCEPHFSNLPCTHLFVRLMKGSFHTLMRGTPTHMGLCSCTFMHIMCIYAHTCTHTHDLIILPSVGYQHGQGVVQALWPPVPRLHMLVLAGWHHDWYGCAPEMIRPAIMLSPF